MNFVLDYKGFENSLVTAEYTENGSQYLFKFENNYGASVIKNMNGSYGNREDLWELAVIKWDNDDWDLDYSTNISENVIGYLSDINVRNVLKNIRGL